jgi:hypothetical protein
MLTNEQLKKIFDNPDDVNWESILNNSEVPEEILRSFSDKIDTPNEYRDSFCWRCLISEKQKLSESFIRDFQDKLDLLKIASHQDLSEDFIREFKDKFNWKIICCHQKLSENFIREHQDYVNWNQISYHQDLSEDFILEFKDKLNMQSILNKQKVSVEFLTKKLDLTMVLSNIILNHYGMPQKLKSIVKECIESENKTK